MCSDEFSVKEIRYMLCPNEAGCTFSRNLAPRVTDEESLFEMLDGTFLKGDTCNFIITNPYASDYNDVMYLRVEYYRNCFPILIKGESLANPVAMYEIKAGQDYTALKDINFYLLW